MGFLQSALRPATKQYERHTINNPVSHVTQRHPSECNDRPMPPPFPALPPPLHPFDGSQRCPFIMWICMESLWAIGLILYYVQLCCNYTNRVNGLGGGRGMGRGLGEIGPARAWRRVCSHCPSLACPSHLSPGHLFPSSGVEAPHVHVTSAAPHTQTRAY